MNFFDDIVHVLQHTTDSRILRHMSMLFVTRQRPITVFTVEKIRQTAGPEMWGGATVSPKTVNAAGFYLLSLVVIEADF